MIPHAKTAAGPQTRHGPSSAARRCLGVCFSILSALPIGGATYELGNTAFHLAIQQRDDAVEASLTLKPARLQVAAGPYLHQAELADSPPGTVLSGLSNTKISPGPRSLTIRGQLAGLDVEQVFSAPADRPVLEERIRLKNLTARTIALRDFAAGFQRRVTDAHGQVLPELAQDRWVAVPFRARATDPKGHVNDFSISDLITKPGYEPRINPNTAGYSQVPSPHRPSEGWAWLHGEHALGIFAFCQEHMRFSVVSAQRNATGATLRFGGARMIAGEPAALGRIAPGETVDLGFVRYQAVAGGYVETAYAFRRMLDEQGCRFPKDYNPPIHWEQLYDMEGAWDDRPRRWTKAILEKEAQKGVAYSCEALYLDPGWDTAFGTFLWGENWLGPRRQFVEEMQAKFGLKVALHCPLATWVGISSMGPPGWDHWPKESRRIPPTAEDAGAPNLQVPAVRDGWRNLALLPEAKASASSVLAGYAIHKVEHLNDGWFGNRASWIAGKLPAWAEIDLGRACRVSEVRLGNDHAREYSDRAATKLRLLVATEYAADSRASSWQTVAQHDGERLLEERSFRFAPVQARWVRVEILKSDPDLPRLDEIEIYEADPPDAAAAAAFTRNARRGPKPAPQDTGPRLCLGSKQYLAEAEKRLLANCADGVAFVMYDGNWWNGGCADLNHSHPVPYRWEDHIRASLDLAQRVHARYPNVLIEMHDMLAGGTTARLTPVYYMYGLPRSYDENWGFELMWNPMDDLKQGRARSLYYYSLGCNVPVYLHIDLRKDNDQCVVLWWYASTCRRLGIGGTHPNPAVVSAQQRAMRCCPALDRFYKRGEFFGLGEDIHLHVLPEESAFVVNLFNLSDQPRVVAGSVELERLGLDPRKAYGTTEGLGVAAAGRLELNATLPRWSARVAYFDAKGGDPSQAPPATLDAATAWLKERSTEMIRNCRRKTKSGIAAFPPQVGGGYEAFWLRDYAYMLEGNRAAFSDQELKDAYRFFLAGQRADGAMVDCIKFDGTPCYMPGYGTMGKNPVADGSQFMVDVAWHTFQQTRDTNLIAATVDALLKGMNAVPRNPATGLVHIKPGPEHDRCPYGFTDAIRKQGDELFCSLLLVQAGRQLGDLLEAARRPEDAAHWRAEARRVAAKIREVFWDGNTGLFRAATVVCNQPDIWGSAFAVYLDVATPEQAQAVARYFKEHYHELVKRGQLRHLPGELHWEQTAGVKPGTYQNGAYWATPVGWFVYALDLSDPKLADRTVVDLVRDFITTGDENECVNDSYANVSHYVASVTLPLDGIRAMQARRQGRR